VNRADLFDELRAEIGCKADLCDRIEELYAFTCKTMFEMVPEYEAVSIYMARETFFERVYHSGKSRLPVKIQFGDHLLSIAAVRGDLVCEKIQGKVQACMPFYRGHHLLGVLVVEVEKGKEIDDEDFTFFSELSSLFENRSNKADHF
jgi:hypothetical protein